MSTQPDIEGMRRQIAAAIHAHWKLVLAQGIVLMVLGLLAVAMPNIATLAVEIFVGWLFLIAGILRAVSVWHARQMPGFGWSMLGALLAVLLGLILIARPLAGVLTLTMVLVAFFILEGITAIVVAVQHRDHLKSWGWVLFSGIIDLLLAYLIWQGWPSSAGWAIGLLVGINMIFFGLSLVMTALAARLMGPQSP
ncbi:MAG: HdeD family acid-resistance protein [Alphaproteobacteria bacterium]|nr:MAG: HdeD family acid-resistance protein [Alphaproteobacteria bacterium]